MQTFLALLLVFALSSLPELPFTHSTPASPIFAGSLAGTVRDDNNKPIAGALVSATFVATGETRATVADNQGSYEIFPLPVGEHKVAVSAPGFTTRMFNVNVQDRRTSLDVKFDRADRVLPGASNRCRVEGYVKNRKTGAGIAGAKVIIRELDTKGRPVHETKTDNDGKYEISNVSPGLVKLEASEGDYKSPEVRKFRLANNELKPCDIPMKPKKKG
jgi:hypothetical protein